MPFFLLRHNGRFLSVYRGSQPDPIFVIVFASIRDTLFSQPKVQIWLPGHWSVQVGKNLRKPLGDTIYMKFKFCYLLGSAWIVTCCH